MREEQREQAWAMATAAAGFVSTRPLVFADTELGAPSVHPVSP